jgi:hypothetical protein
MILLVTGPRDWTGDDDGAVQEVASGATKARPSKNCETCGKCFYKGKREGAATWLKRRRCSAACAVDSSTTKLKNIAGRRFGSLTVTVRGRGDNRRRGWVCVCDCGKQIIAQGSGLRAGRIASCGCQRKNKSVVPGAVFHNLTVISDGPARYNRRHILCLCKCGDQCIVSASRLLSGHTKSCGCIRASVRTRYDMEPLAPRSQIMHGSIRVVNRVANYRKLPIERIRLSPDELAFRELISAYRSNAKAKCREFSLSHEEACSILTNRCHYCGIKPYRRIRATRARFDKTTILTNGIDRIDNRDGYVAGNCVPCCANCNFSKRQLTEGDFAAWVFRCALHMAEKPQYFAQAFRAGIIGKGPSNARSDRPVRIVPRINSGSQRRDK